MKNVIIPLPRITSVNLRDLVTIARIINLCHYILDSEEHRAEDLEELNFLRMALYNFNETTPAYPFIAPKYEDAILPEGQQGWSGIRDWFAHLPKETILTIREIGSTYMEFSKVLADVVLTQCQEKGWVLTKHITTQSMRPETYLAIRTYGRRDDLEPNELNIRHVLGRGLLETIGIVWMFDIEESNYLPGVVGRIVRDNPFLSENCVFYKRPQQDERSAEELTEMHDAISDVLEETIFSKHQ